LVKDQQQQTAPKWLDRNQQLALLREVRKNGSLRDYAIFQTFLGTGLRISELAAVTLEDLEINDRSGWLRVRSGKGTKSREVPLDLKTRQAIEEYKKVRPTSNANRLFLGQRGTINSEGINYLVAEYSRRAGLDCTPHTLRHSYAKNLVDMGTPLDQVAILMGHESLDTTKIYTKPSRGDLEQAVRRVAGEIE
jgi:integrase/recombinase XerC